MSLRARVILLIVATVVLGSVLFAVIAQRVVVAGFADLEAADAAERLDRVAAALDADLEARLTTAREVATSQDAAMLLRGERTHLADWRETPEMLARNDLDAMVFVDPMGQMVHLIERDGPLPPGMLGVLTDNQLRLPEAGRQDVRGIVAAGGGLAAVVAHEVPGRDLPLGVAITVRRIDGAYVARLQQRSFLTFDLWAHQNREGIALAPFIPEGVEAVETSDTVRASGRIVDPVGRYLLTVATDVPRAISAVGREASQRLLVLIVLASVLIGAVTVWWFEHRVLSRLTRLGALVSSSDRVDRRPVRLEGDDELAQLAIRIERTLTSLEHAQEELRDTNAELAIANELKDDFVSMVSHEFRTPLTSIRGYADTILRYGDDLDPEKRRTFVVRIAAQTVTLTGMVDDLLTLSQVRRGTMRHEPEDVPVREVIGRALVDLQLDDVVVDIDDGAVVEADRDHVRRILTNYIENAAKYGDAPIEVTSRLVDGAVELRVRDHGPGVPEEFVPALFDRFTQASVGLQRTSRGVGLGLSIVHTLAELNGGRAWYEDGDPGAVFVVSLPAASAVEIAEPRTRTG